MGLVGCFSYATQYSHNVRLGGRVVLFLVGGGGGGYFLDWSLLEGDLDPVYTVPDQFGSGSKLVQIGFPFTRHLAIRTSFVPPIRGLILDALKLYLAFHKQRKSVLGDDSLSTNLNPYLNTRCARKKTMNSSKLSSGDKTRKNNEVYIRN